MCAAMLQRPLVFIAPLALCSLALGSVPASAGDLPRPHPPIAQHDNAFTLAIISDPQFHRVSDSHRVNAMYMIESRARNEVTMRGVAAAYLGQYAWPSGPMAPLVGSIVNGDLTERGLSVQRNALADIIVGTIHDDLELPLMMGLGNHDYLGATACWDTPTYEGPSGAAIHALQSMRDAYANLEWVSFDTCSLAYSFDIGDYHFVQLENSPGTDIAYSLPGVSETACHDNKDNIQTFPGSELFCLMNLQVTDSFSWLENDLREATERGKHTVLNMHVYMDSEESDRYWTDHDRARFRSIVFDNDVVAVFAGHVHSDLGEISLGLNSRLFNSSIELVPVFRSGASFRGEMLLAEFGDGYFRVGALDSDNGSEAVPTMNGEHWCVELFDGACSADEPPIEPIVADPPAEPLYSDTDTPVYDRCGFEGGSCTFSGTRRVLYGAGSNWAERIATGSVECSNAVFGDPAPGVAKTCYHQSEIDAVAPTASGRAWCASEWGFCSFSGQRRIYFGAGDRWFTQYEDNGTECTYAVFGDPAYGSPKTCYLY